MRAPGAPETGWATRARAFDNSSYEEIMGVLAPKMVNRGYSVGTWRILRSALNSLTH